MTPIKSRQTLAPNLKAWIDGLIFVVAIWLLSRLVIIVAIQLIAPLLPFPPVNYEFIMRGFTPNFVAKPGWELFSHWDGAWYRQIATLGYDFVDDRQQHAVAFFPLFPLITRGVMTLGLPFEVAGTLVNNVALLGALLLLYQWAQQRYGIRVARWATAVLAWCPLSLYGTVIYTEGLFLLLTTAALRSFDNRRHVQAALWAAMATATRATGTALVPTFLLVAWIEKRPLIAYQASLVATGGLLLFSTYCALRFGDPLAFVHVQKAWPQMNLLQILTNALHLDTDSLPNVFMLFGGAYLLWHLRSKLPLVAVVYGVCSLALIFITGAFNSASRYVYGIVSLSLALGLLLAYHPRWGYPTLSLFATLLVVYAIKFAWWYWVA